MLDRRQLTPRSCELVGAARLATLLARKIWPATASGLHGLCREIVESFDGLREMAAMGA